MAAEARARAESPAYAAPPPPVPEKRAAAEDDTQPGPKRRRAFVATLDGVACAAAAHGKTEEEGHGDVSSFSFQHARGDFVALETTPKFGSFNPPAAAEQQEALDPKPAPPAGEDILVAEDEEDAASPRGVGDPKDENARLVAAAGDQGQGEPGRKDESESAVGYNIQGVNSAVVRQQ